MQKSESGFIGNLGLWLGPALFIIMRVFPGPDSMPEEAWKTAAVAIWIAVWWMTEAIPIPATAQLPHVLLPLLGVTPMKAAAAPYANKVIFLFLGGFMIAQAVQRWNLHKRLALKILSLTGTHTGTMIAGFMLATAFISMWVSNTATVVMMMPIGASLVLLVREQIPDETNNHFAICLMLGMAYAASIGGAGTLIGTPPNAHFAAYLEDQHNRVIEFAEWMRIGVPIVLVSLPITWLVLTRLVYPIKTRRIDAGQHLIREETEKLGPMSRGEILTAIVFLLAAGAWIFRQILSRWVDGLSDAGIAVAAAILLFMLPVNLKERTFVLDWKSASQIRWDVLLLFGGGLSLAAAISQSGL
ncbi:MAG: DASS family sodium-coupled anion symporter, partial [Verrucomicrobiota bacterium]